MWVTHSLYHLKVGLLLQCGIHGTASEDYWQTAIVTECGSPITSLLRVVATMQYSLIGVVLVAKRFQVQMLVF